MRDCLKKLDKTLLITSTILIIAGLIMVFSSSNVAAVLQYKTTATHFFVRQLAFVIVGLLAFFVIIRIKTENYNVLSVLYLLAIFGIMVLLKFKGAVTNDARSWLSILGFRFQPSEFSKPAIVLFLACILGGRKKWATAASYLVPFVMCGAIALFVALEPDLGTAIIIAAIVIFLFYAVPIKSDKILRIFKIVGAVGIVSLFIIVPNSNHITFLTPRQKTRLDYKYPCLKKKNEGYQVCNGYIAMHNGGLTGAGLSKSKQKYLYLPEAHTDFIFPIIVEELGVVGGGALMLGYIVILLRLLMIARRAKDLRGSIIAAGTFIYIFAHIVVNLGGLLALIPLTGVPLPFMSYGGSFMINVIVMLSLSQRVAIESKMKGSK